MKRWILALIAVCSMFLSGCQNLTSHGRTITVTGSGSAQVVPDIATFLVQVDETRPTTGEALAAANRKVAQVLEILKGQGIASKDIATQSVRLAPSYEWKDNAQVLVGQSSRQSISVKVRNLDQLGAVVDKLGSVDSISLASLAFDKEDKNDAYAEAREEAVPMRRQWPMRFLFPCRWARPARLLREAGRSCPCRSTRWRRRWPPVRIRPPSSAGLWMSPKRLPSSSNSVRHHAPTTYLAVVGICLFRCKSFSSFQFFRNRASLFRRKLV